MKLPNDIVLRPRFTIELKTAPELVLQAFEAIGNDSRDFVVSRVDDHVFIRIPKHKQHFWSPQLHLEIYRIGQEPTQLKGLFGPNPTVWTLFMFLHFMVVIFFVAAGIWLYSNASLSNTITAPVICLSILFIGWFMLYFAGRIGKTAGKKEMNALHIFMYTVLTRFMH